MIVGGPLGFRAEALRRAAAEGLRIICLHPPGEDSEAYYQVLAEPRRDRRRGRPRPPAPPPSRQSPGSAQAIDAGELGAFRGVRHECPSHSPAEDLARVAFPRVVDVIRSLLGEIEALTASGDPPGVYPEYELVVQLRAAEGRRAEVRVHSARRAGGRPASPSTARTAR